MSSMRETAAQLFDACETGQGWEACSRFCHADATFSAQADTFAEIETVEAYTDQTECVVRERYPDSAAVLEHAVNLGELMPGIAGVSDPDLEIYGNPSDELLQAIAMPSPRVYSGFQSL